MSSSRELLCQAAASLWGHAQQFTVPLDWAKDKGLDVRGFEDDDDLGMGICVYVYVSL